MDSRTRRAMQGETEPGSVTKVGWRSTGKIRLLSSAGTSSFDKKSGVVSVEDYVDEELFDGLAVRGSSGVEGDEGFEPLRVGCG